jgi:hypothetical protein
MVHALWSLFVPSQTAASGNVVYWNLHNDSTREIYVTSVVAIRDVVAVVSGTTSMQLFLTRTSAVATGGTEATSDGSSEAAATISKIQQVALPSGITARRGPTGGGTAGAIICERHIMPEETIAQPPVEFLDTILTVPEGTGIRVMSGPGNFGSIGFQVLFY